MIVKALVSIVGGIGLSLASLFNSFRNPATAHIGCEGGNLQSDKCMTIYDLDLYSMGFPFSYVHEKVNANFDVSSFSSSESLVRTDINLSSAIVNFVFWAVVATVVFKLLSWVFEKASKLTFIALVVGLVAVYLGLFTVI